MKAVWIYIKCRWIIYKKQTKDKNFIYQNKLNKGCFQHDMNHEDFKDLTKTTASHKILRDKPFYIAKNPKNDGYQRGLFSMVYNFLIKKFLVVVLKMRICETSKQKKDHTNHLLENSRKSKKYAHLL